MTPLFTIPQEMLFVALTVLFFAALIGDLGHSKFFRDYKHTPSPWNNLSKDLKALILALIGFFTWAQNKDSLQIIDDNGLTDAMEEVISGRDPFGLQEEDLILELYGDELMQGGYVLPRNTGISWAVQTGNPPFSSNAVLLVSQFQSGFACVAVTNIQAAELAMPPNAIIFTNWPYAVARQSVLLPQDCLPEGFTFGGRPITNLYMAASGVLSFDAPKSSPLPATNGIPDSTAYNYIAVFQTPSDIVPTNGLFWYAPGTNSTLFTWKDVYLGQDTNCLATVQAELYRDGDFTCRYYFPSPTNSYAQLTNAFLIGAQNLSDGEIVLYTNTISAIHSSYLPTFELRWKTLVGIDTEDSDQDGDGIPTADELFITFTDPRLADTDGDGLSDPVEVANATDPLNPDANSDNIPDGTDLTGYSLSDTNLVFRLINNIAPEVDLNLDSDGDGWADWLEVRFGTATNDFYWTPQYSDALFSVTVTLEAAPAVSGVLSFGTKRAMVTAPGTWTFWLPSGQAHPVIFTAPRNATAPFNIALNRPDAIRYDKPSPDGRDGNFGKVALQLVTFDPDFADCCHENHPAEACETYTAIIMPQVSGTYAWDLDGTWFTNAPNEVIVGHDVTWARLRFTPSEASAYREAWAPIHVHCAMAGVETNNPDRVAANNNDDDADEARDNADSQITGGDSDIPPLWPLGRFNGSCCQCPDHQPFATAATLAYASQNLALYTDATKTSTFGGTISAGQAVYVEGLSPSTEPDAEKLIWQWTDNNETKSLTNALTVLSVRLFPDLDYDDDVDATDIAGFENLSSDNGWIMPAATNVLRKIRLRTDVGLSGGVYTLSLSGAAGSFRVWADNFGTTTAPLLVCGQTITNGINDVTFLSGDDSELYLEAASAGTATITYSYYGEGIASNIVTSSSQTLTAMTAAICSVLLDAEGRLILGSNGKAVPDGELGWDEVDASTFNPLSERGAPQMENVSALLGGIPEWVAFIETQGGAELTITKSELEGFKTWELEYEGMTNGMPYYTWSDGSNSYVRVTVTNTSVTVNTTNGIMGIRNLNLTIQDESFNLSTNEINATVGVYRDIENTSDYFSNYTIADPRENVGLPPFSERNALVVRFNPMGMEGSFVCTATDEDDHETEIPLTLQSDGTYVSALIVPISELDENADLGLENSVSVVRLKLASGTKGWERVSIDIKNLGTSANNILKGRIVMRHAMLLSALVTNEEKASARYDKAVVEAGENVVGLLRYGVTPVFSPDSGTINTNLLRHRVWIHSGHGCNNRGIMIVGKTGSQYRMAFLKATDILRSNLDYDLVFMNACLSTDVYYRPIIELISRNVLGWETNAITLTSHAVKDIGTKLNAKNYVGWDTEVYREVSSDAAVWFTEFLDTKANGELQTVEMAVTASKQKMFDQMGNHRQYANRLRLVIRDDSVILDLNKRKN